VSPHMTAPAETSLHSEALAEWRTKYRNHSPYHTTHTICASVHDPS
jgi:hypothetical protein